MNLSSEEKDRREERLEYLFNEIVSIVSKFDILDYIDLDMGLLMEAIDDYFEDINRMKEFHNIERANVFKIYSYTVYWLLRRKPIQIVNQQIPPQFLFINEKVCVTLLLSWMEAEMNAHASKDGQIKVNEFSDLLFYNFISEL